jgi:molybdopterin molybdotransferase
MRAAIMNPTWKDVRMRGFQDRTDVEIARSRILAEVPRPGVETVSLTDAGGRVLADAVVSTVAIPPFDRAAMDGYAVRGEDTFGATAYSPLDLALVGEVLPGREPGVTIEAGQAARIMTGAPLPSGADAVVPAEYAEEAGGRVRIKEPFPPGRHVGRRGEDIAEGTTVLAAGRRLRPQDLGVLASIGAGSVTVCAAPRVRVLITGDELLPAGSRPEGYRIVDSNSPMLRALIHRDGGIPDVRPLLADRPEVLRAELLAPGADVVLISGGSSVGQEDHAPRLLAELGRIVFHGVALRPASPAGFGVLDGPRRLVFLLPGNPVSCLCAYDLFAGPAVRSLGGQSPALPYPRVTLPLARKLVSAIGRVDYCRVRIEGGQVEPLATSGASNLTSTTRADGFVLVPADSEGYPPGDMVEVHLYDTGHEQFA